MLSPAKTLIGCVSIWSYNNSEVICSRIAEFSFFEQYGVVLYARQSTSPNESALNDTLSSSISRRVTRNAKVDKNFFMSRINYAHA